MRLNVLLLAIAGLLLAIVLYRMGTVRIDRRFWIDLAPLILSSVALAGVNQYIGGKELLVQGFTLAWDKGLALMPVLIVMFVAMGEASALIEQYKTEVISYLNGSRGFVGSAIAAFLTPGSLTGLPIVRDLWETGAGHSQLIVFLVGSSMVNWQIFLIRASIVGWGIALVQYVFAVLFFTIITISMWGVTFLPLRR